MPLLWSCRGRRWRSGEKAWPKHIDDLGREYRLSRIQAESARAAWLMERLRKAAEDGAG